MKRVREYFYGRQMVDPKGATGTEFAPMTTSVNFHDVMVRRIGESVQAPDSALPIGAER